jgi:hypothetical protein
MPHSKHRVNDVQKQPERSRRQAYLSYLIDMHHCAGGRSGQRQTVNITTLFTFPPRSHLYSRSECFSSDVFVGCMDTLLVEKEARIEAATLVDDIHSYY